MDSKKWIYYITIPLGLCLLLGSITFFISPNGDDIYIFIKPHQNSLEKHLPSLFNHESESEYEYGLGKSDITGPIAQVNLMAQWRQFFI